MDTASSVPTFDAAAIAQFCEVVFGYLDGRVALRLVPEKGTPDHPVEPRNATTASIAATVTGLAARAAANQRAVFVVPVTLRPGSQAKAEDAIQAGVILADLDSGNIEAKRRHLVHHLGPPSMEVASGGVTEANQAKLHLYWRLAEAATGADLDRVANLRLEIAIKAGGDDSFKSIHQPIRVAGTIHGKYGKKSLVRLLAHSTAEYELDDLAEAIHAMPSLAGANLAAPGEPGAAFVIDTGKPGPTARDLAITVIREGGQDAVTRFAALSSVIGHWLRTARMGACSLADAWDAVKDHNTAMMRPPWDEDRLRREFEALRRKDFKKYGPMPATAFGDDAGANDPVAPMTKFSEDAIAARFVLECGNAWKHVATWGKWYLWTGTHWAENTTGLAHQDVRLICRATSLDVDKAAEARKISSGRTMTAVQKIAASDPGIALGPEAFDRHPMLLNTPDGILDLETGSQGPHDPLLLLTQITSVAPATGCPRWLQFLDEVTGSDHGLQAYLARLAGYCLTGSIREQAFFFLYGSGANGKSVFLQVLVRILSGYAATATSDTFSSRGPTRHLTELAGLRAARLVIVSETEAGEGWAEARIKAVTGGEAIRANFMYRDHFEYYPQFKLIVAGNYRPKLEGLGEAMRRRIQVVPFDVTIPPSRRDPRLVDALVAEAAGILAWMIDGCAAWQQIGLSPPPAVLGAAEAYFDDEDHVGHWIEECCTTGRDQRAVSRELFSSWTAWCEGNGYEKANSRYLGEHLRAQGFQQAKVNRGRGWLGIGLRRTPKQGDEG